MALRMYTSTMQSSAMVCDMLDDFGMTAATATLLWCVCLWHSESLFNLHGSC